MRTQGVFIAAAAALALAGCTSVVTGKPAAPASAPDSTSQSPDNTPAALGNPNTTPAGHSGNGAFPSTSAGLAAFLHAGSASVTSAHVTLSIDAAGESITGSGDEQLADGKSVATEISETVPGAGTVGVIVIGTKVYVKLPASLNPSSTKPWTLITANSDPALSQIFSSLQQSTQGESLSNIAAFIEATAAPKDLGAGTVNGVSAEHYSLAVDVTKLPDSFPGKSELVQEGLTSIPIDLWVDAQGRTTRLTESLTADGQQVSVVINLTKYNVPVHITAPPANEVGNG